MITFGKLRNVCKWCVEYEAMQNGEADENAHQHVMPVPWASGRSHSMVMTQIFAGICAAVFIGMALASEGKSIMDPPGQLLISWGADFGPLTLSGDWWRLLTSMFVHGSIIHIALNMWCLWSLGELAESLYGRWTFAAVYLISGLAGSVVSVAHNPNVLSVGASGAVFGIAGALIASLKLGNFSLPREHVKATLSSVVTFAVYNLIFGAASSRIDNAAHIGGLIAGLILGALIALAAPERDHTVRRITLLTFVLLLVIGGVAWMQRTRGVQASEDRLSVLLTLKRYDQASAELQKKLAKNPNNVETRLQLARVYYYQDRIGDAESELKRVLSLAPTGENAQTARLQLGFIYVKQKRFDEAKQLYTAMMAASPSDLDVRIGLGMLLEQQGNYPAAIEQFEIVAKTAPQTEGFYYDLGNSYAKVKRYDEAIAAYRNAQQIDRDDAAIEMGLAEAYEAKGMKEQADAARRIAESFRDED